MPARDLPSLPGWHRVRACFPVVTVPKPPLPPASPERKRWTSLKSNWATSYQASSLKMPTVTSLPSNLSLRLTHMRLAGLHDRAGCEAQGVAICPWTDADARSRLAGCRASIPPVALPLFWIVPAVGQAGRLPLQKKSSRAMEGQHPCLTPAPRPTLLPLASCLSAARRPGRGRGLRGSPPPWRARGQR